MRDNSSFDSVLTESEGGRCSSPRSGGIQMVQALLHGNVGIPSPEKNFLFSSVSSDGILWEGFMGELLTDRSKSFDIILLLQLPCK